ncbi:hypothetical protein PAXINDRAFT_16058 [Paxillus involutus ATCC 200175]|uniref:Uncharacterized protein n=1 Tax=Paxillus involutus ATCC 200175 TaxID=664439 RepID=A0A0C9TT48_PAXIN|nr:hypothetical protein PAXINDRAFT_16058 [Paxillus involutus ATCC 200175]
MSTQMPADRPPPAVPGAGGEASYYDHEGRFWEGSNSLKPSNKSKNSPASPTPPPSALGVPENPAGASLHASPMASDPPAVVEPALVHRTSKHECEDDTLHPPSTGHPPVLGSHRPVSTITGPRASWKSLWHPSRGCQPEITAVYAPTAQYPHVAAADPSEPAKVPPQSETVPGNYATHAVLPPSPPDTLGEDSDDDDVPNESPPGDHGGGAFCGLCSRLFSCRSTPRPNDSGADNSGVEMNELHVRTEDEPTSATGTPAS